MEVVVLVEVDEALQYARQKLVAMQKKAPQAVRTALNKTAREAKKQDERITKQTYTAKGVAASLKLFNDENYVEQQTELLEILRFDVFCEIPQWRPEWLKWQTEAIFEAVSAFWRDEEKVRRYISAYKFSSWRQIHKLYPIELFKADWETGNEEEIFVMLDNSGEQQKLIKLPIEVK